MSVGQDRRMQYFSAVMAPSEGRHSVASKEIKNKYGSVCWICQSTNNITMAHILAGNSSVDYSPFSRPVYKNDLDVKSERNFLLLCGLKGQHGTCHNEFDKYMLTLLYDPLKSSYTILSLNKEWVHYNELNGTQVILKHHPYRRLLAWRTRYCFQTNSFMTREMDVNALINAANFSEESYSIADFHEKTNTSTVTESDNIIKEETGNTFN